MNAGLNPGENTTATSASAIEAARGLQVQGWFDSPIRGGDGNREFFVMATRESR